MRPAVPRLCRVHSLGKDPAIKPMADESETQPSLTLEQDPPAAEAAANGEVTIETVTASIDAWLATVDIGGTHPSTHTRPRLPPPACLFCHDGLF